MLALKQHATGAKLGGGSFFAWASGIALAVGITFWLAMVHFPAVTWAPASEGITVPTSPAAAEGRWLGMRLEDCPTFSGKPLGPGVVVAEVQPGSPAALAGVQTGDIILFVEDQLMSNTRQVAEVLQALPPQAAVMLEVRRSGAYLILTAKTR